MTTSTITWNPVADGLPDPETNVLLALNNRFTCEGFLDLDPESTVWRDVCAVELPDGAVTHWAEMPVLP